jgi:hypothetical protein
MYSNTPTNAGHTPAQTPTPTTPRCGSRAASGSDETRCKVSECEAAKNGEDVVTDHLQDSRA